MRSASSGAALLLAALLTGCTDHLVSPGGDAHPPATGAAAHGMEGFAVRGEVRTGYIIGYDGTPMQISFEVHDGRAIFEGDIDVGPADSIPATPEPLLRADGPRYAVVRSSSSFRWPSGVVPYVINPSLPDQWRVTNAIAHIQSTAAGVQFVPRTNQSSYVYFTTGSGCSSAVGRVGGVQNVTLASGCTTGNTIHEIGHALGMHHEHSRCDRDTFVNIWWSNIQSGQAYNFDKQCSGYLDIFGYSEGSVMHYPTWAFGIGGATTISSKRGLDALMGQRNGLAQSDISSINWMYQPYAPQNVTVTNSGGNALVSWSPSAGATHYTVGVLQRYDYYDHYTGWTWGSDYRWGNISTTATSVVHGTYTGETNCIFYPSTYDSEEYTYWYELRAYFPDGISSPVGRWLAPIGQC